MKMKLMSLSAIFSGLLFLASCGGGGPVGESSKTGWTYNDQENGAFEVNLDNIEQETGPGLVLVEGGAFQMGNVEQNVMYSWDNMPRRVTLPSFYMDETEVANVDYLEYLHWIKRVFVEYPKVYVEALPDTLVWRRKLGYNEPYVNYYFRHPSYQNYPVVGVNWLQANDYAAWRTDRVNEGILIREGVLDHSPGDQSGDNNFNTDSYLAGQYEGLVKDGYPSLNPDEDIRAVRMEDGVLLPAYTLPTEAQWEYAALSLAGNSEGSPERIWEHKLYPWNGHYLRNDTKDDLGQFNANFQRGRGDMMGVAGALNDAGAVTVPVVSYWPNDYNLYCMAGNVNEWVLDVYRPMSSSDYDDFRPFRGNVFQVKETDASGNFVVKDSLGRMKYRDMTDDESLGRHNYNKAYNVNSGDGDITSSVVDDWMGNNTPGSNRMYKQGDEKGNGKTSLVTDHVRVYKGGGWRDRAYWLSPGNRRFLDENESSDDIGFRCAMIRTGSPTGTR